MPPEEAVCQILSIKKIVATQATAADRYRIILSDGIHFAQGESACGGALSGNAMRVSNL